MKEKDTIKTAPSEEEENLGKKQLKPSFKRRVRDVAVEYIHEFEDYFVNHEYLLCPQDQ